MKTKSLSEYERLERKANALRELVEDLNSGKIALVVEGMRDRDALERVGIRPDIIFTPNGSPQRAAEQVSRKGFAKAAVLTDFDRRGELLVEDFASELNGYNVAPDTELRKRFNAILGLRFFEEAATKAIELDLRLRNIRR